MDKKGVLELKRRYTKEDNSFTKMCGCYVDGDKNKVINFSQTFLNLEEDEMSKYLEIAKKVLSGTIGNNLLKLEFPLDEEMSGGKQQFLMGLRESELKNEDLLDAFYDHVIENFNYAGNYLILIFYDTYDVMTKTTDNLKVDESEEVFQYILCAICPVALSKPGLGYREDEHRIGSRIRDWVVGAPDTGFMFPAFTDRSTDVHSLMFYTKNAKAPHTEFMEAGLGCISKKTATEKKIAFNAIVKDAYREDEDSCDNKIIEIQQNINDLVSDAEEESEPVILTPEIIYDVMEKSGVEAEKAAVIKEACNDVFGKDLPFAETVIDDKIVKEGQTRQLQKELLQKVEVLEQQLTEKTNEIEEEKEIDIVLHVKPEKVDEIEEKVIDGKKCLIIPLSENEKARINGQDM